MSGDYTGFFASLRGGVPYPYQVALAEAPAWPEVLSVPTGLGKTAAVLGAWLHKRLQGDAATPRRLVWCLPMRTLVEQTAEVAEALVKAATPQFQAQNQAFPSVHVLMGGAKDDTWIRSPDHPAILIGTQDMLLSRALMRGWGLGRFTWPMGFAFLHNDALWVFDEVQIMGTALATSAQLEGLRRALPPGIAARSLWMSATLQPEWLATVDFAPHLPGLSVLGLDAADHADPRAAQRLTAEKTLAPARNTPSGETQKAQQDQATALAQELLAHHQPGTLTLAVVNTVARARMLYQALGKALKAHKPGDLFDQSPSLALIHSRFRLAERSQQQQVLCGSGSRIVVATQAIEAGVDVSAALLVTELAPWASLVQRFGRCNRDGLIPGGGRILWVDLPDTLAAPYAPEDLAQARTLLKDQTSAAPTALPPATTRPEVRTVLRRRDLLDLFDTEPDLTGFDVDIAPYVRDSDGAALHVFWRDLPEKMIDPQPLPEREEVCPVTPTHLRDHLAKDRRAFIWDARLDTWKPLTKDHVRPGLTVLLDSKQGGYSPDLGFDPGGKTPVPLIEKSGQETPTALGSDWRSQGRVTVLLADHLRHVADDAAALCDALAVTGEDREAIVRAALWHDVGKAHAVFQETAGGSAEAPLAKWADSGQRRHDRPYFRHELASALAFRDQHGDAPNAALIAYLIAAHHGKVRLSIRPLAEEAAGQTLRLRGVEEGDALPAIDLGGRERSEALTLSLAPLSLGGGWTRDVAGLLDRLGPFRLAWLESLVRVADWRASATEQKEGQA